MAATARHGIGFLALLFLGASALATVDNGGFDADLSGWTAGGAAAWDPSGAARLSDDGAASSHLWQPIALSNPSNFLTFDFYDGLASDTPDAPPFAFPDAFFMSLYFTDDPGAFDLSDPGGLASLPVLDYDASGFLALDGAAEPLGPARYRIGIDFWTDRAYVVPVFELFDLNGTEADSYVLVDNVELAVVPEPLTMGLVGMGLAAIAVRSRFVRQQSAPRRAAR